MTGFDTLKRNGEFRRLYGRGRSFVHPLLVTYVGRSRGGAIRIGVTTGKKIGNAVRRNRARRVIMAAFRACLPQVKPGYDLVFVARTRTPGAKSTEIRAVMQRQLREAGLWRNGDETASD